MAEIQGTAAGETLAGTGGDDVIVGGGGTDRIEGGLGNDVLTGGDDGGDTLYGESGNDQLYGGGGADSLHGGLGDDVVHGGAGDDYIKSDETGGSDVLYGDGGDDRFEVSRYKGFGAIQAYGGDGNDYFNVDVRTGATIAVDAGDGDDWVDLWSWDAAATVTLGAGRDLLSLSTLGTFNGTSSIGATVTDFQAGPAGDVVDLADALASYAPSWNGSSSPFTAGLLSLTQSGADAILSFGSSRVLIFKNVSAASFTAENFAGFSPTGAISAPLSVAGTDAGDILAGGSGDDTIDGGGGRDRLFGGMGADSIHGGDGVDFIDGGAGNDAIDGGAGQDTIYGGFGDDVIHGGADSDWISDNDTGTDVLWGDEGNDQLWVQRDSFRSGGSVTMYGGEGNDGLFVNTYNMDPVTADGGIGNDRLTIYTLSGSLTAILGDGADVIDLGSWTKSAANAAAIVVADFATGAAGDRLEWANFLTRNATGLASGANPFTTGHARLVQSGADVLLQFDRDGGANGFVTLITFQNSLVSAFTAFNFSGFASDGSASAPLNVSGTDAADRLFGEGGGDSILGLAGNDVIYGLAGGDSLAGGNDDDLIYGGAGDDVIDGGAGNDTLYGEHGADIVTGGAGDDYLSDTSSGSDSLAGGDGNDTINVSRSSSADSLFVDGGDGADHIYVSMSGGSLAVDAGAGDDLVTLYAAQSVTLTLGAGSDTISFYDYGFVPGAITITDFQGGEGGDRLDLDHWLADELTNFQTPLAPDPNPFATGHFKLVQSGADAVLQLSMNGGGSGYSDWITFKNTDVWSLTAYNFDGYASPFAMTSGTAADETFQGGTGNDGFDGGGGNDTFLIGYGGTDKAVGAAGDDIFFVAVTAAAASHQVAGGGGNDLLQLQGHGALAITIGASAASGTLIQASGIETIQLLAGADSSRAWGSGAAPAYTLTLKDEASAAGTIVTVDASGLAAGETLNFSTDEKDSTLHLTGGAGNDVLRGGALGDVISGGEGHDQLQGGGGNDQLDGGNGNDLFVYDADPAAPDVDTVTGGAGIDELSVSFSALASPAALTYSLTPDGAGGYDGWFASGPDHRVEFTGIELFDIEGTNVADEISGTENSDFLFGAGGDDLLRGNGGADLMTGDAGVDTLIGGAGDDLYLIEAGDAFDTVIEQEGEGYDQVNTALASYTLQANFEKLVGTSGSGQTLTGNGLANSIIGLTGNDVIDGGAGADSLNGGAGNDIYYVDDAGDTVADASGTDEIRTSLASYTLAAGVAIETLTGLLATGQALTGNSGVNTVRGGAGDDILAGAGSSDVLWGGAGNDQLDGGTGSDVMRGEQGDDVYTLDATGDLALENAGEGIDKVLTALASHTLAANVENLTGISASAQNLRGNALDNIVAGGAGGDTIRLHDGGADKAFGNDGNDVIYFGAALTSADEADGGAGTDILALQGNYAGGLTLGAAMLARIETLQLLSRTDARYGGSGTTANRYSLTTLDSAVAAGGQLGVDASLLASDESLTFNGTAESDGRFLITGGLGADMLTGGAGADVISGGSGNDLLDGGAGVDTLSGGPGNDVFIVDDGGDVVQESAGAGTDEVRTSLAAYTLTAANVETLRGTSAGGQALTAGVAGLTILGAGGSDTLDDGGFAATLNGGLGDDFYTVRASGTVTTENAGEGLDTVRSYAASHTLGSNLENLVGMLATGQTLVGNSGANTIAGGAGNDRLDGGAGADAMAGGLGNDVYVVDHAGDSVTEAAGEGVDEVVTTLASYTLGANFERLIGGTAGGQALTGNALDNYIAGGAGNDRLDGGAGGDSMYGGAGNDLYLVDSADQVFENAGEGVDEVRTAVPTYVLGANFENLTATGFAASPLSLRGNALDNVITSEVGAAIFLLQDGGADVAYGATNNDVFYFGAAYGAGDRVNGAFGSDEVVLQGAYGALTLAPGSMTGIQKLSLLSAGDNRFGAAAAGAYSYDVTVPAGFTSAMPGLVLPFIDEQGALVVDASGLAAGESLHFDASAADPAATYWSVRGGAGADHLVGGAGGDDLRGGGGDDLLEGGAGNDYLDDSGGGSNVLRGGEGDDLVNFDSEGSATWSTLVVEGGDGDDWALFYAGSAGTATIDMGAGDDRVDIRHMAGGSARLTLGGGRDTLAMAAVPILDAGGGLGAITVADFQAGAGGDRFEWPADLTAIFAGWTPGTNPFEAGYARLVQSGADTLLQVSPSANGTFATLLRFENLAPADFTGDNLGGWSPLPVTGGAAADQLVGTASSDFLFGEGGNDFLFLQHGGDDSAHGGDGNDVLYFGGAFTSLDRADGGEGRDAIVLQGDYALTLSETNIAGIESISLQSGANTKFGDTANNFYDFAITMADGNVLPGQQLIVNAQSLRAGEDFTFNGSAEHDGKFLVYGGHGVDHLTGGDGVDVFFFEGQRWGADDKVDGGAGRDSVVISAGNGLTHIEFAADALTNIESISVNNHFATDPSQHPSYELVLNNGNVTPGGTLIVNGSSLATSTQFVNIDGSGVHDGNLILFGGAGNDALIGGAGADTLFGAGGADNLTGGAGADVFRYDATSDSTTGAVDDISGFQAGLDKIDLSRIDADTLTADDQAFSWIGDAAFSHVAGELRFYESGGYGWVEGDTNGDGSADFVIALTAPPALLAQGDFLL
jgi:Ca2+-binding RTX toxin-like protein